MSNDTVHIDWIKLNKDTAPMLLELLTKAAAAGPQAKLLADLYAQAEAATKSFADDET